MRQQSLTATVHLFAGLFVLLTQAELAPLTLRTTLAVFGVASFGEGVCSGLLTLLAPDCVCFFLLVH